MMPHVLKDKIFWLLAILAVVYILGNIGTGSLSTWDEAIYANISGNILKTGDWIVMHENAKPWFDKPPFCMWCTAFFYKVFGINEFSARLTSSLFGVATVLLLYVFVRKVFDPDSALLAALLLLAAPHYLHYAKQGTLDVTLTFFVTLMIFLFWSGREKPPLLFWSGLVLLVAYLTKGFGAISGPAVILIYCLFSGNLKLLVKREFLLGIFISVLGILLWHLGQYILAGPDAISNYFGFHIFKRATTAVEGHTGGPNSYQKTIFNKNIPWSAVFYASLAYISWLIIKYKDKRAVLIISWIAAVYILCSLVQTKLHWYIMPIYPAFAISSGIFLAHFFRKKAFFFILSVILLIMLAQVPLSKAFKLDFNAKAKNAAADSIELPYRDDGTIFYYETVKIKNKRWI